MPMPMPLPMPYHRQRSTTGLPDGVEVEVEDRIAAFQDEGWLVGWLVSLGWLVRVVCVN